MLKLSKLADYAILVVYALGKDPKQLKSGSQLANETTLPLPTVRKILALLLEHKILQSIAGAKGGYSVTRPLDKISLFTVLCAIDGEWALTACHHPSDDINLCIYQGNCQLKQSWSVVNHWLMQMLGEVSIAEMANGLSGHSLNQLLGSGIKAIQKAEESAI